MADGQPARGPIRFGPFEVDLRAREVRKEGRRVKLQDQPFRVLRVLLEHSGEVVTREDLQRRIWPADTFVDFDKGLNNAVKRLREALGDAAENPLYVETLPRHGYRFIGSVFLPLAQEAQERQQHAGATERPRRRWRESLGFAAAVSAIACAMFAILYWNSRRVQTDAAQALKIQKIAVDSANGSYIFAAISPDGKYVAYCDAATIHIKFIETGEEKVIPLPQSSKTDANPPNPAPGLPVAWFPDGTRVLVSTQPGPTIWSVTVVTGIAQKLYSGGWGSSVSPDGALIAFMRDDSEIWLMGTRGEGPRQIVRAENDDELGSVFWSPDSQRIGYMRMHRLKDDLPCAMESRDLTGHQTTVILSELGLCQAGLNNFWWSRDGRIFFDQAESNIDTNDHNLWEIKTDAHTGKPLDSAKRLTNWVGSYIKSMSGSADGKRLAFQRTHFRNDVSVGEVGADGSIIPATIRSLASGAFDEWPTSWTPDSRAVLFYSAQNGSYNIFRQEPDARLPEPIVTGTSELLTPRLSPDGSSLIYMEVASFKGFGPATPVHLMRVPVAGGPAQLVVVSHGYDGHRCSRRAGGLCVLGERSADGKQLELYSFDPSKGISQDDAGAGHSRELFSAEVQPGHRIRWDLSPDGTRLAIAESDGRETRIRFVSTDGRRISEAKVRGVNSINSMDWSADDRTLFASSRMPEGIALLQIDLLGNSRVIERESSAYQSWAIPSPNGKRVAILMAKSTTDLWMAENF